MMAYPVAVQRQIDKGNIRIARNMLLNEHVYRSPVGAGAWKTDDERLAEYEGLVATGKAPQLPLLP